MDFSKKETDSPATNRKMLIDLHLENGYGSQPGAWRMPGVDPESCTSFDVRVKQAQASTDEFETITKDAEKNCLISKVLNIPISSEAHVVS
jgi:organic hydroperoxide reductase OsmC/OhrA